jgi:hypothetical protein
MFHAGNFTHSISSSTVVLVDCDVKGYLSHWYLAYLIIVLTGTAILLTVSYASAVGTLVSMQSTSAPQFSKHFPLPVFFSVVQLEISCLCKRIKLVENPLKLKYIKQLISCKWNGQKVNLSAGTALFFITVCLRLQMEEPAFRYRR